MSGRARDLGVAIWLVAVVWTILLSQSVLKHWLGAGPAVFASFAMATGLVWMARGSRGGISIGSAVRLALGAMAGVACFPIGMRITGFEPSAVSDPFRLVSIVLLAPVFEELLYRERLLLALREITGGVFAVVLSSALFALPHLEPRLVLPAFLAGLALGAMMLVGRSVALCIGFHMGLNLASVVGGAPHVRLALLRPSSIVVGLG